MKKQLVVSLIIGLSVLISPTVVLGQGVASPAGTVRQAVQDKRVTNLQTRGVAEIDRRLMTLDNLLTRLNSSTRLSNSSKAALIATIQNEITGLTALKGQIQAETDLVNLRVFAKSITDSYRVYGLVMPQVQLVVATDRVIDTGTRMATVSAEIEADLVEMEAAGQNVTTAITSINSAMTKIENALKVANTVQTNVLALTPAGYPGNRSTLTSSRQQLRTAITDLATARKDITGALTTMSKISSNVGNSTPSAVIR